MEYYGFRNNTFSILVILPVLVEPQILFLTRHEFHVFFSLKKLATLFEEEMKSQSNSTVDLQSEAEIDGEVPRFYGDDEISLVVKDLLDPAIGLGRSKALQRYMCIGKQLYQEACQLDEKIGTFEINISRSYFHVKALDASQLENWHRYLDFVEMQGDFDWVWFYIVLLHMRPWWCDFLLSMSEPFSFIECRQ